MKCVRCRRNPRKYYRLLQAPVDVVIRYDTHERKPFKAGEAFCGRCFHAVLKLYGGHSEGLQVDYDRKGGYVRSDGVQVL